MNAPAESAGPADRIGTSQTSAARRQTHGTPQPQQFTPRPLAPRPRLFLFLSGLFAIWMSALLVLYFTTVYPRRHQPALGQPVPQPTNSQPKIP
jgi:hypothetical protein